MLAPRGIAWPNIRADGAVRFFLGTVNPAFDVRKVSVVELEGESDS